MSLTVSRSQGIYFSTQSIHCGRMDCRGEEEWMNAPSRALWCARPPGGVWQSRRTISGLVYLCLFAFICVYLRLFAFIYVYIHT